MSVSNRTAAIRRAAIGTVALLACGACGESPPAHDPPAIENVLQDQIDALDKAQGVQETLDEANRKRAEQIEEDGG